MKSLVFGGSCGTLLANFDRESLSWKTCQISFGWVDQKFLGHFPKSGMIQNGKLYALQTLAPLTAARGGFVSPIILPTPVARMAKNNPSTPGAWKQHTDPNVEYTKAAGISEQEAISNQYRLDPSFVEWIMGFPIGFTELDH